MKIRTGFVSNSSSSSFAIWGVCLDREELDVIVKTLDEEAQEAINEGSEMITEYWIPEDLEVYEDWESEVVYIGRSWSSIGDDETGREFKEKVQSKVNEIFGREIECGSIETEIYS